MMSQNTQIMTPMAGSVIPLEEVPDKVFASRVMGDGFGVVPSDGTVRAPVSGTITMVAKTLHAFGVRTPSGIDVLVHMGIDTVELNGEPFTLTITRGQEVNAGEPVATMDLGAVEKAGKSTTTIVVFTNLKKRGGTVSVETGTAGAGDVVATVGPAQETADSSTPDPSTQAGPSTPDSSTREGLTGNDALAYDIIEGVGGKDNISSVIHCITRVRFYLKDQSLPDDDTVANLDGVIDVAKAGGQYQVVIGATVGDVYKAIVNQLGTEGEEQPSEPKERPTTTLGWVKYGFSSLIGVITGSMIPVVGVLAASGILKGILALLTQFGVVESGTDTYQIIDAMASSMFFFLPIIIGFTSAKRLGADPIIVAIIGGVLVFPSLITMAGRSGDAIIAQLGNTVFNAEFFGIPISLPSGNAYAYSIFPIIVGAWLASKIEPWLKKWIPPVVHSIFAPLLEIFIVSTLLLVVFGPVIMLVSGSIAAAINWVLALSYPVAGAVIGGFYQVLVIFGLHWAVIPIIAAQIADPGYSPLNAIVSATMIAQGGGALALWIKAKNPRIKRLAGPATISAFCGVTEPAMYGLNLKYGRVFVTASIGGAIGGLLTGLFDVNMWGFTGAFVGFPSFVNPAGIDGSFLGFWIASFVTLASSFALTYFFGFTEDDFDAERTVKKVRLGRRDPVAK